jgi:hypothetical protein
VNDGEVKLINFTISSLYEDYPEKTYQAEEGMTWEDFCNSKYNVDNWYLRDAGAKTRVIHQYGDEEAVCLNRGAVDALDIIVPSGSYKYYL